MSKALLNKSQLQYFLESRRKFDQLITDIMGPDFQLNDVTNDLLPTASNANSKSTKTHEFLNSMEKEEKNDKNLFAQTKFLDKMKQFQEEKQKVSLKAECWNKFKAFMQKHQEKLIIKPCRFRMSEEKVLEEFIQRLQKLLVKEQRQKRQSDYELEKCVSKENILKKNRPSKLNNIIDLREENDKLITEIQQLKEKLKLYEEKKLQQKLNQLEFELFQKQIQNEGLYEKMKEIQTTYLEAKSQRKNADNLSTFQPVTENFQLEVLLQKEELQTENKELKKYIQSQKKTIGKLKGTISIAQELNVEFVEKINNYLVEKQFDDYYSLKDKFSERTKVSLKNSHFKIVKSRSCAKLTCV